MTDQRQAALDAVERADKWVDAVGDTGYLDAANGLAEELYSIRAYLEQPTPALPKELAEYEDCVCTLRARLGEAMQEITNRDVALAAERAAREKTEEKLADLAPIEAELVTDRDAWQRAFAEVNEVKEHERTAREKAEQERDKLMSDACDRCYKLGYWQRMDGVCGYTMRGCTYKPAPTKEDD